MKTAVWALTASGGLFLLAGCGLAANPQPPTAWLPEPVHDLAAVRVGQDVQLHWTMPKNTTDKVALKGEQRAHLCWTPGPFDAQNCKAAGDATFAPDKPASFIAHLPAAQTAGAPRTLSFFVELQNHAGKTAGPSNAALVASGPAPAPVQGLHLQARAEGVVLHWQPAAAAPGLVLRMQRTLVKLATPAPASENNGAAPPEQQTLEVDLDQRDPGQALDRDALLNHTWRYTAERVLRVAPDHHPLEISGLSSPPVTIDARDVFPPQVPVGLAAVPDEQAHSIDLSWTPDSDADLAGYFVYRRDLTAGTAAERISGKAPLVPPSFDDHAAIPGHRYAYSVSAVDRDGNESARSSETEEQLPQSENGS